MLWRQLNSIRETEWRAFTAVPYFTILSYNADIFFKPKKKSNENQMNSDDFFNIIYQRIINFITQWSCIQTSEWSNLTGPKNKF